MSVSSPGKTRVRRLGGAYGLAFAAESELAGPAASQLIDAPPGWPEVHLTRSAGESPAAEGSPPIAVEPDSATISFIDGGGVVVDRAARTASFRTPRLLSDDELIHPALVYPATVFAHWLGRVAFHGGAFEAGDGAWGLLGNRGMGKSSTLGWLAGAGHRIVADDMLVIEGGTAFAGPRSIDLQPATAAALGLDGEATLVRVGQRRRLTLAPLAPGRPMRGWVRLAWGEEIAVTRVPPAERLPLLVANGHRPVPNPDVGPILDLAALPALELRRPKRLDSLPHACEALLDAISRLG